MIGRLTGRLVAHELDGTVVIEVGGVGYEVMTPAGTAGAVGDEAITFYVHTHVREEALDLFGFVTELERRVFRLLIGVPNVGPKTALGVLAALPPPELIRAVHESDLPRLNKVSGIGKKTAERLVLELKEKLRKLDVQSDAESPPKPATGNRERLLGALTNMGYRGSEAEKAVRSLGERLEIAPLQQLIREALAFLAR